MFKRSQYIAFLVAILIAVIFLNLPGRLASRLKVAAGSVFVPLFGIGGSLSKATESGGLRALPKGTLIKEVEKLRQENAEFKIKLMQSQEVWRENGQLRDALIWQRTASWRTKLARVVTRDPANWWRTLQIDMGSKAGVITNLPVITPEGLVGRVDQVGLNYSRVVLLGDPNCRVHATIENQARDTGAIVPGDADVPDESIVELTYISRQSKVQPGQRVTTSGLDGIFPKGIPIGHIIDTNSVGFDLYLKARVKLTANLRQLEQVWVLFP
jgi:rod shape-determining protein MreC